jgi:hypothetical protein
MAHIFPCRFSLHGPSYTLFYSMSNATKRPVGKNPMIFRKATAAEIKAAQERAALTHEHRYMNHVASPLHVVCSCGWMCRRDAAPVELIFSGPVRAR